MSIGFALPALTWRRASIVLGFTLTAMVMLFWQTAGSVVATWSKDPFAHGYMVIPGTIYLIWNRKHDLERLRPAAALRVLPLIGLFAFLWLVGSLAGATALQQVLLVAMVMGFVWGILGSSAARLLLFPMGFLLFALPLGNRFIPALQDLTAVFVVKLLALSGVPVLQQGHLISIPGWSWKVAEACGGINYLTASLAIGYLYAGTAYRSWLHRIGFLIASAIVPLVGNGLRVYGTVVIAYVAGAESVAGTKHYLFGWLVFATMTALLFAICGRWREVSTADDVPGKTTVTPAQPTSTWRPAVLFATSGLLLVGIAPLSAELYELPLAPAFDHREAPSVSSPWLVAGARSFAWNPHLDTASAEFAQTYDSGNHVVKVYIGYYSAHQPRVPLTSVVKGLFPEPWWTIGAEHRAVSAGDRSFRVRETHLEGSSASVVVWSWHRVDGRFTDNDYLAQLLLAKARLFRSSGNSASIAVATESRPGLQPAAVLQDFLLHLSLTPLLEGR